MATIQDKTLGGLLILLAISIFTYYTLWVIVLPFLDSEHFLRAFFLPPAYAITLPLAGLVFLLAAIGIFVAIVLIKDRIKKKAKTK